MSFNKRHVQVFFPLGAACGEKGRRGSGLAPGTHKGPSTPNPAPCHYISPGPPPRSYVHRAVAWWEGGVLRNVVARGGWEDVGGPCGCQAARHNEARMYLSLGTPKKCQGESPSTPPGIT